MTFPGGWNHQNLPNFSVVALGMGSWNILQQGGQGNVGTWNLRQQNNGRKLSLSAKSQLGGCYSSSCSAAKMGISPLKYSPAQGWPVHSEHFCTMPFSLRVMEIAVNKTRHGLYISVGERKKINIFFGIWCWVHLNLFNFKMQVVYCKMKTDKYKAGSQGLENVKNSIFSLQITFFFCCQLSRAVEIKAGVAEERCSVGLSPTCVSVFSLAFLPQQI